MSRLRRLDRRALEAEARRVGITTPSSLGREELVQAIARRTGGEGSRGPRSLLGRAVAFAVRTLDGAAARLSSPPPRPSPPSPPRPAPAPPPSSVSPAAPPPVEAPRASEPAPALDAPARDEASSFDEPIPTRTMARLLSAQGHHRRALAIYDGLVRAHPGDRGLVDEAAEVRAEARAARASRGEPPPASDDDADEEGEPVVLIQADRETALLAWGIGESALARARRALGSEGVLVARVVVLGPDPAEVVRTEIHERAVAPSGHWALRPLASGVEVTAAVGLREGSRFVSVAHAAPRAFV